MASELQGHISAVVNSLNKRNGSQLAALLALPLHDVPFAARQFVDKIKGLNVVAACERSVPDSSIASLVGNRLSALISVLHEDFESGKCNILLND